MLGREINTQTAHSKRLPRARASGSDRLWWALVGVSQGRARPSQAARPVLRETARPLRGDPWACGGGRGQAAGAIPSCLSVKSLEASSEGRARPARGLPGTMRTRSLLFILLYLFSDLLTNWRTEGWTRLLSLLCV